MAARAPPQIRRTPYVTRETAIRVAIRHRKSARLARPDTLRGLYVNRWAALGDRMWALLDIARRTEVNALVIDVKDDRGLTLYRSHVKLANEIGADTVRPMSAKRLGMVLDSMHKYGVYPIARIVVVKDPLLAMSRLDLAIKRRADMKPWLDKNGKPWLDPTQRAVWQYAVDLAREAYAMGFSEVQFDYVRFPDEDRIVREAVFPLAQRPHARDGHSRSARLLARRAARERHADDDRRVRAHRDRHDRHGHRPALGDVRRPRGRRASHGISVAFRARYLRARPLPTRIRTRRSIARSKT